MADLLGTAWVAFISGRDAGALCFCYPAHTGLTDCLLLETNELTGGATWHAAGNVATFPASWTIMNMQRCSAELCRSMNYHVTGSIRLAHSGS